MTEKYQDKALIRRYLEHLRISAAFARSSGLYKLLKYVVDETLDGRGATLKELVIGDALYGRSSPYDPRIDSAVRVEARRLRQKLANHYAGPGRHDPVRIELQTGSYAPEFEILPLIAHCEEENIRCHPARKQSADLAVMPFRALSVCDRADRFADGLTDQLIFALGKRSTLKIAPRLMVFQFKNRQYALSDVEEHIGARVMLHGTYRPVGDRARVTVEICDCQGFVTWSSQIDHGAGDDLGLQETLSGAILARLPAWIFGTTVREHPLIAVAS